MQNLDGILAQVMSTLSGWSQHADAIFASPYLFWVIGLVVFFSLLGRLLGLAALGAVLYAWFGGHWPKVEQVIQTITG